MNESIQSRPDKPDRRSGADRRDVTIETREVKDGQYVFRQRETGEIAFLLISGTVEIVKTIEDEDVVLATLEKGSMFGEMALIDNMPRMASARAVGHVQLKIITREMMDKKIATMDPFARGLIRVLSQHVREMAKSMRNTAS